MLIKKRNKVSGLLRRENMSGFLSVLPALAVILLIRGYPLGMSVIKSFSNWDGITKNSFVGLKNYINILSNDQFWYLLKNNIVLLLFIPIQLFAGVIVATLLYEEVFGWKFFRSMYYIPQIISPVVIGFLFSMLFSLEGPVNTILINIGLERLAVNWLGSGTTGLIIIILCLVWINIGWQGILVLGGMSSISPAVLEASRIDGAGYWTRLFRIILPMIVRVIEYSCIVSVIWTFTGLFPFIHTMTQGGPGYETTTVDYMIYLKAFVTGTRLGEACAIAVILFLLVLILTIVQRTVTNKLDDWS